MTGMNLKYFAIGVQKVQQLQPDNWSPGDGHIVNRLNGDDSVLGFNLTFEDTTLLNESSTIIYLCRKQRDEC